MACFLFLVLLKYPIKVLCGDVLNQFKCMKWNITALCWSAHKAVGKQNVFLNLWSQGYVKAMWKGFVVERNLDWWKISSFKFTITRHFLVLVFFLIYNTNSLKSNIVWFKKKTWLHWDGWRLTSWLLFKSNQKCFSKPSKTQYYLETFCIYWKHI